LGDIPAKQTLKTASNIADQGTRPHHDAADDSDIAGHAIARQFERGRDHISLDTNLCERTRTEAYQMMCAQADANGADAILMMRYDANEIFNGVTEVICYGSAVIVEEMAK